MGWLGRQLGPCQRWGRVRTVGLPVQLGIHVHDLLKISSHRTRCSIRYQCISAATETGVSQCGHNDVLDELRTVAPSVLLHELQRKWIRLAEEF
jgi:hypothetical protein